MPAGVAAEVASAGSAPPVEACLPVARCLLAVEAGRGGGKDECRTLPGKGLEQGSVTMIGTDGESEGRLATAEDRRSSAWIEPLLLVLGNCDLAVVAGDPALLRHHLGDERLAGWVSLDQTCEHGHIRAQRHRRP